MQESLIASEQAIRVRSYLLWERDGRPHGRSEMYWFKAKEEIDAEIAAHWNAVSLEAGTGRYVVARPEISRPPVRRAAAR